MKASVLSMLQPTVSQLLQTEIGMFLSRKKNKILFCFKHLATCLFSCPKDYSITENLAPLALCSM